jgi:hypothetical protein
MVSAVMNDASSDARKAAAAAMSSTAPNLFSVLRSMSSFLCTRIQVRYMQLHEHTVGLSGETNKREQIFWWQYKFTLKQNKH